MTTDDIAKIFPGLAESDREQAAAIFSAAEPLHAEIAKLQNANVRASVHTQVSNAVVNAVQMLGQK